MLFRLLRLALAALLAAAPPCLAAQPKPAGGPPPSPAALAAQVDSVIHASLLSKGVPSASVAIVRSGETLLQTAWGVADPAAGLAADAATLYEIGSTSKQFTAALILRLVDRGRLALSDPLGRHLAGLRPEWRSITVEQLLNHTSGLQRSYLIPARVSLALSGDSLLAQAAQGEMAAAPGAEHIYSNTGYMILAVLVEKLYGTSFGTVVREELARPLGLASLRFCGDAGGGARAVGHHRAEDGALSPPPPIHPSQAMGAGGICTTAADLATWNQALHGGRVLSEASYRAMITPRGAAVADGYGFGIAVGKAPWGSPALSHGGQAISGFVAENSWYPNERLSVTLLYNVVPRAASGGTHVIAGLALGHVPPAPRPAPPAAAPTLEGAPATGISGAAALRLFVGEYQLGPGVVFRVGVEEGALVLTMPAGGKNPLVHQAGATYAVGSAESGTTITFLANADGAVVGFLARAEGSPDRRLPKVR